MLATMFVDLNAFLPIYVQVDVPLKVRDVTAPISKNMRSGILVTIGSIITLTFDEAERSKPKLAAAKFDKLVA